MDYKDKRVIILGAARQGTSLARYLAGLGASIVLTDLRRDDAVEPEKEMLADVPGLQWVLGEHPLDLLDGADLVCPSGGVPLTIPFIQEALVRGIPLSNDSQVFMEVVPCKVIGITGSAGKTTTTTLVGRMGVADPAFRKVWVGGNIGDPLISYLDEMQADDLAVLELSSFQLDQMTLSPQVAAVLNITPNHLDRHGTMEAYTAAKRNIFAHQGTGDTLVLGAEDPGAWVLAGEAPGQLLAFAHDLPDGQDGASVQNDRIILRIANKVREVLPIAEIEIPGEHNVLNVLAAVALAAGAGISDESMRTGVQGFSGVPHRLEFVRHWRGADWVNDSKATGPSAAIMAMRAFSKPIILLAGGRDKSLPWDEFAEEAVQRARHIILFGEAAALIRPYLEAASGNVGLHSCATLKDAVLLAAELAQPGMVVLLAPGGASFDEFKDFEERGEKFKAWVQALPLKEGVTYDQ